MRNILAAKYGLRSAEEAKVEKALKASEEAYKQHARWKCLHAARSSDPVCQGVSYNNVFNAKLLTLYDTSAIPQTVVVV